MFLAGEHPYQEGWLEGWLLVGELAGKLAGGLAGGLVYNHYGAWQKITF